MFTNILLFKTWCFRRFHNHQTWDSFRWRSVASRKHLSFQVFVLFTVPAMGRARQHKRKRLLPVNCVSDKSKLSSTAYSFKSAYRQMIKAHFTILNLNYKKTKLTDTKIISRQYWTAIFKSWSDCFTALRLQLDSLGMDFSFLFCACFYPADSF
jgi:hypothetical protein